MIRTSIPAEELFTKARSVGQYYGFHPFTTLTETRRGLPKQKIDHKKLLADLSLDSTADAFASILKQCYTHDLTPNPRQPYFLWHTNITPGRPVPKRTTIQFHALGNDRSIADAVVIRALVALARDLYHDEPVVRINSMGDKETRARYARELNSFFKKRGGTLPEECVNCAKEDVLAAAELALLRECVDDLPAPTEHLSDASRKRFEDLLEYLEKTETPYELARHLISRGGAWSDTCFEIVVGDTRVAWGSRYNDLAKRFFPQAAHAVGAVLQTSSEGSSLKKPSVPKHRVTFIHIGDEAKHLSIKLAEDFRKARVPLAQHIGTESLTEQMHLAEEQKSPYLLIMGRQEALDNTAILRDCQTQQETTLPVGVLIEHLKRLK